MANENDQDKFAQDQQSETGQDKQPPTSGQQGQSSPTAESQGGESSTGQTDAASDTTLAEREQGSTDDTSASTEPGQSGGFVASHGSGSDEQVEEQASTDKPDFASQGQGATTGSNDDQETGQSNDRGSDA